MKKFYRIRVFDSRFQVVHVYAKKIKLFEEIRFDLINANLFAILFRNGEIN